MNTKERFERAQKALAELQEFAKSKTFKQTAEARVILTDASAPKSEAKADIGCVEFPVASQGDILYLSQRLDWLRDDLSYFRETFYEHLDGHLPSIQGATAMTKALKALGLDGDYKVEKQTIYASDGSAASTLVISRPL